MEKVLKVGGMKCVMCARTIENVLKSMGVKASVNFATGTVLVEFDESKVSLKDVIRKIEELGYKVEKEEHKFDSKLFVAIFSAIILFFISFYRNPFVEAPIAVLSIAYSGKEVFVSAFRSIANRSLNMDVMYSIGVTSALVAAFLTAFGFKLTSFDTPVVLLAFLLLGRNLEERARKKTSEAIEKLVQAQPKVARVLRDGVEVEVPAGEVREGEIVIVGYGERVPVDGVVVEGEAEVDESPITGEFSPKIKRKGDKIVSGSILKGTLKIRAERVGADTVFARIVRLVEEAVNTKPPIERFADRVVEYFIPVVLAVAFLALIIRISNPVLAVTSFISVLVVACPCAFGLATPTAIAVGIGRCAEKGILIKSGEVLEAASKVKTVIFDKTGTLTEGKLSVDGDEEVLKIAATAEKRCKHPIAEAVLRKVNGDEPDKFEVLEGMGVVAEFKGKKIAVGNKKLMKMLGIKASGSNVVVAVDGKVVGEIKFADKLRDSAFEVVSELKKMGLQVIMVTGDSYDSAKKVAESLGIEFFAEMLPEEKVEVVKRFENVAFVGDGINDAPAIAQADVGIAVETGTDIAVESGDIVVSGIEKVPDVFKVGRKVMGKIKQNVFWALAYNSTLIPLAVLYPSILKPELAAMAMAMSSVTVVLNSLMLKV